MLPDLLGYDGLAAQGLSRHGLDRLIESGEFERIAPGLFLRAGLADDTTAAWMAVAAKQPDATLCLARSTRGTVTQSQRLSSFWMGR